MNKSLIFIILLISVVSSSYIHTRMYTLSFTKNSVFKFDTCQNLSEEYCFDLIKEANQWLSANEQYIEVVDISDSSSNLGINYNKIKTECICIRTVSYKIKPEVTDSTIINRLSDSLLTDYITNDGSRLGHFASSLTTVQITFIMLGCLIILTSLLIEGHYVLYSCLSLVILLSIMFSGILIG